MYSLPGEYCPVVLNLECPGSDTILCPGYAKVFQTICNLTISAMYYRSLPPSHVAICPQSPCFLFDKLPLCLFSLSRNLKKCMLRIKHNSNPALPVAVWLLKTHLFLLVWFGDPLHCVSHKMSLSNNLSSSNLKWKTWWWPAAVQEKKTQRNSWSSWLNSIKRASLSFSFIALKFHFSPAGESFAGGPLRPLLPHPLLLCRRCRRRPHISWTGQRLKRILGILIELLLYFVDGQRTKPVFFSFPWLRGGFIGLWVSTINSKKHSNKCSVGHCSKI